MTDASRNLIDRGLRAWRRGGLDAVEAVLDEQVSLRWYERGDGDCSSREEMMRRPRAGQVTGIRPVPAHIDRLDDDTFPHLPS